MEKRMLLKIACFLILFSCNEDIRISEKKNQPTIPYKECLSAIDKQRIHFQSEYLTGSKIAQELILDSVSNFLEESITQKIIPYWYGTPWDFNGHTDIPNEGEIACGYFVSTTLKHFGFKLNRYKFAQQSATSEAKTLQTASLKTYRNKTRSKIVELVLEGFDDGLYLVGLDNHVGYLQIKNGEVFFIHSNYCTNQVEKEKAAISTCFTSSVYVIGEISTNRELLKKWILGTNIPIHMD